jgi:hypothetical protein
MSKLDIECMSVNVYTNDHNEDHDEFIMTETVTVQIISNQGSSDVNTSTNTSSD